MSVCEHDPAQVEAAEEYAATGAVPYQFHRYTEVEQLFEGLSLIEPGLVSISEWRPDPLPAPCAPWSRTAVDGRSEQH